MHNQQKMLWICRTATVAREPTADRTLPSGAIAVLVSFH
jgi:hypothetical protein